jgi:predicted RNase H-like HicB family nuclease
MTAMTSKTFTAIVHQEGEWYVADCPEAGTVSQGRSFGEAVANMKEATELYIEEADALTI